MSYDLRISSPSILEPIYSFPEDDAVELEVYRKCIVKGYISSISTVYGAARGCGLDVDSETVERWKRVGAAAGMLDDFLDESPDMNAACDLYEDGLNSAFALAEEVVAPKWADPLLEPSVRLLRNSVVVLPLQSTERLFDSARAIGAAARQKAKANNTAEYVRILKDEALHSGVLIHGTASEYVRAQPEFKIFTEWARNAMELGTLVDSARDLRGDKAAGRTNVEVTPLNGFRIALSAYRASAAMVSSESARRATIAGLITRRGFYSGAHSFGLKMIAVVARG